MIVGSFLPAKIAGDSFQLFVGSVGVRSFCSFLFFLMFRASAFEKASDSIAHNRQLDRNKKLTTSICVVLISN
jgi:hypothetical protein